MRHVATGRARAAEPSIHVDRGAARAHGGGDLCRSARFHRLADGRLPYDALYIVDRYVATVSHAITAQGGTVTSVAGDGITAFFDANSAPAEARRQAPRAIAVLWQALDALAEDISAEFQHALRFAVGCHVGLAVISKRAQPHAVQFLGEVGNIAARLEALTKVLDCVSVLSRGVVDGARLGVPTPPTQTVRIGSVAGEVETIAVHSAATLDAWLAAEEISRA